LAHFLDFGQEEYLGFDGIRLEFKSIEFSECQLSSWAWAESMALQRDRVFVVVPAP